MKKSVLHIVFCFSLVYSAFSQNNDVHFNHITPENGLSQGHILSLLQDREGYIWIATYYGLNRYNGYTIKLFSNHKNDPSSLANDVVYCLFEDKDGYIWVGTSYGLNRFDKKTEKFEHYSVSEQSLSDGYVRAITQDYSGNIWIGTNAGGLNKLNLKTGKFTYYSKIEQGNRYLPGNIINDAIIDHDNTLWFVIDGIGIASMNLPLEKINYLKPLDSKGNSIPVNTISCIFEDSKRNIWFGSFDGKLYSYSKQKKEFLHHDFLTAEYKSRKFKIRQIREDLNGNILIATDGAGLVIYNPSKHEASINLHNINDPYTISSNEARSLLVDRSGTVFVGTYGRGISKYSPANNKFEIHNVPNLSYTEGESNSFTDCAEDDKGRLIIGTYNGFFVYDTVTWHYKHYLPGQTYADNKILVIKIGPDKSIWIGTNRQLHRYDQDFKKIQSYSILKDNIDHPIYAINFDHLNNLWFGVFVAEGLFKVPESEWRDKTKKDLKYKLYKNDYGDSTSTGGDQIWSIVEDRNKNLWIGNNTTVSLFNPAKDNFRQYRFTDLCKSIAFDNNGILWVATRGDGVFSYNLQSKSLKHYTTADGLCQNFVFGVIIDQNNHVWLTSENGLSRLNPQTEKFRNYDMSDGLPSNRFDDRSEKMLSSGKVYLGTANGFIIFKPENIQNDTCKPNVVLSGLRIDNIPVSYQYKQERNNIIPAPINQLHEIKFKHNQRDFTLEFAALHYSTPHKNNYKYMLVGFDKDWIQTDANHRSARYTNLNGGKYTFLIKASNADGIWNETPLSIKIVVTPPFYRTILFNVTIIALLILITILTFRMRLNREIAQKRKLALMVRKSTAEILKKNTTLQNNAIDLKETNKLLQDRQIFIEKQKEELSSQRDELQHLIATKDKLFSIIAHDLKNPFNIIIGFSELLIQNFKTYSDEKKINVLNMLHHSAHSAYALLENLLQWSRSQSGNVVFSPTKIAPEEIIEFAIKQTRPFAQNKQILLKCIYGHENAKVYGDSNMLIAILRNLILNAIKFSMKGDNITITTSHSENDVEFSIQDHGIGMAQDVVENLFRIEYTVSQPGTSGEKGTGLGLQICNDFIKLHRGQIRVSSMPGKGSTFSFTIPVHS
jgi:signal transduction histidine kinase/ligand-binding sensor domain-containing protein